MYIARRGMKTNVNKNLVQKLEEKDCLEEPGVDGGD
jgi:hypothetical protein